MSYPVIVNIPHASVEIPDFDDYVLSPDTVLEEARLLADLYTDELIDEAENVEHVVASVSRLYVDTERFADDDKEEATRYGMGVLYTKTHDGVYLRPPVSDERRSELLKKWYEPHHARLTHLVDTALSNAGKALILDLHSYPTRFDMLGIKGKYTPDICIGCDVFHGDITVLETLVNWCFENKYTCAINNPFSGSVVPLKHYEKKTVTSFMLEIRRSLYMNEKTFEKTASFFMLQNALAELIGKLSL